MKNHKLLLLLIFIVFAATACHSSKKAHSDMASLRALHRELKQQLPDAEVIKMKDSIKVIYPEVALFDFDKDEIKPTALPSLKKFAKVLNRENQVYFIINGYTDNVGTSEVNNSLSLRRATNAKAFFKTYGIDDARMVVNGMGSSNPIMGNATDAGRQANRRVEFILYKRCK